MVEPIKSTSVEHPKSAQNDCSSSLSLKILLSKRFNLFFIVKNKKKHFPSVKKLETENNGHKNDDKDHIFRVCAELQPLYSHIINR